MAYVTIDKKFTNRSLTLCASSHKRLSQQTCYSAHQNRILTLLGALSKVRPLTWTLKPPCLGLHWEQPESAAHCPWSKLTNVVLAMLKIFFLGAMIPLVLLAQPLGLRADLPTTRESKMPGKKEVEVENLLAFSKQVSTLG